MTLLVLLALAGLDDTDGWTLFKTKDGAVACAFPAALKKVDERAEKGGTRRTFSCKGEKGTYSFVVTESKISGKVNRKEMEEACARSAEALTKSGYEIITAAPAADGGFATYEALLRLVGKNEYLRWRMVYSDAKTVNLKATGPRDFVKSAEADRVFGSLKVTK